MRPQRLMPCLPICVAILAIASFPQTLSRAMRLPAFPSPTSCYFRPTFLMRTPGTFPTRKFVSSVHRAAAHCTCRPSAGRRWRSRCAPRTRLARCRVGSKIATRRAPRRQARQMRQHHIADANRFPFDQSQRNKRERSTVLPRFFRGAGSASLRRGPKPRGGAVLWRRAPRTLCRTGPRGRQHAVKPLASAIQCMRMKPSMYA